MMTLSTKKWSLFAVCATALLTGAQNPVQAQAAAGTQSTASAARFSVDIKDATLMDALQLVFMAANERSYSIDAAAKSVRVGTLSFKDQPWRDIVRTLTSLNKFRFARLNGVWVVEPRPNAASASASFDTSTRSNAKQNDFSVATRGNAQFGTSSGSGSGGSTSGTSVTVLPAPAVVQSDSPWTIIEPNHTYAGFFGFLFQGAVVIATAETIYPSRSRIIELSDGIDGSNSNTNTTNNGSNNGGFGTNR